MMGDALIVMTCIALASCGPSSMTTVTLPPEQPVRLPSVTGIVAAPIPAPRDTLYGLSVGMSVDEVRVRLGTENNRRDHAETEQWWTSAGYQPQRELPFLLGFDEVLTFNQDNADHDKPVWYVYFAKGHAVLFKAAIYPDTTKPELKTHFGFPPACFVNADASEIEASLGPADVVRDEGVRRGHYYLRRGIGVSEEDARVGVLDLFTPLAGAGADDITEKLSKTP
jgi:hypothetical protein